jgi:hypothetical protein
MTWGGVLAAMALGGWCLAGCSGKDPDDKAKKEAAQKPGIVKRIGEGVKAGGESAGEFAGEAAAKAARGLVRGAEAGALPARIEDQTNRPPYPEPDGGQNLLGLEIASQEFDRFFLEYDQKANSAAISALKEIAQQANPGGKADGKRIEQRIKMMLFLLWYQGKIDIKAGISIKSFRDLGSQWRQVIQQKEEEKNEVEGVMKFTSAKFYGYATGNEKGNARLRVVTQYEVDNRVAMNKALANLNEHDREIVQADEEPWRSLAIMADALGLHNCLKHPVADLSRSLYPEKDLRVELKELRTKARVYDLWRQGMDISQIDTAEDLLKFEAQSRDWRKGIEEDRLLKQAVFYGFANGKEVGDARQRAIAKCQEEMTKAVAEAEAAKK